MLRSLFCAAAILFTTISSASAQLVLFSGAGYVTNATGICAGEGIFQSLFMLGSYLPANLGDNGPGAQLVHVSLPQSQKPHSVGLQAEGALTNTFQRVKGTKITPLEILTFKPRVKLRSKPAVIDETTTNADLTVTIKNANGIIGCDFTLNLNTGRR